MTDNKTPDTTTEESGWSVLKQLAFTPRRPHLLIGLLFLVLGLLVTVALFRPGVDEPWRNARTEDLVQILDDLGARQERLDTESARLTGLQADLERGSTVEALAEAERQLILATLEHYAHHKERTAAALGVSLKTLYNRLKEYGI